MRLDRKNNDYEIVIRRKGCRYWKGRGEEGCQTSCPLFIEIIIYIPLITEHNIIIYGIILFYLKIILFYLKIILFYLKIIPFAVIVFGAMDKVQIVSFAFTIPPSTNNIPISEFPVIPTPPIL